MAKFYARRCEQNGVNFNSVPAKWKDATRDIIEADGYTINADGSVTK